MRTRIAQVVESRARNPEVHGSNSGSGSIYIQPTWKGKYQVRKSQIKGKESENSCQELKRSLKDRTVSVCLCVPVLQRSLQLLVRVFTFLSFNLWYICNKELLINRSDDHWPNLIREQPGVNRHSYKRKERKKREEKNHNERAHSEACGNMVTCLNTPALSIDSSYVCYHKDVLAERGKKHWELNFKWRVAYNIIQTAPRWDRLI